MGLGAGFGMRSVWLAFMRRIIVDYLPFRPVPGHSAGYFFWTIPKKG
jgi:hypothetical protein